MEKRPHDFGCNYDRFPCESYLNNALCLLLESNSIKDSKVISSIEEICHCIVKADGYFTRHNIDGLIMNNIATFVWDNPVLDICLTPTSKAPNNYFNCRHGWFSDESELYSNTMTEHVKKTKINRIKYFKHLYFKKGGG